MCLLFVMYYPTVKCMAYRDIFENILQRKIEDDLKSSSYIFKFFSEASIYTLN